MRTDAALLNQNFSTCSLLHSILQFNINAHPDFTSNPVLSYVRWLILLVL